MDEPNQRPPRIATPLRWSRTALVGLAAVAGVTIMGTAGIALDKLTGSDLVALSGTLAAILGTVAGRPQGGGA